MFAGTLCSNTRAVIYYPFRLEQFGVKFDTQLLEFTVCLYFIPVICINTGTFSFFLSLFSPLTFI